MEKTNKIFLDCWIFLPAINATVFRWSNNAYFCLLRVHKLFMLGWICGQTHCTEVRFASFFSGGFITAIVVNPPEKKLAVLCMIFILSKQGIYLMSAEEGFVK